MANNENKKTFLSPLHVSSNRSKSPHKHSGSFRFSKVNSSNLDDFIKVSSDEESDFNSTGPRSNLSKTSSEQKAYMQNKNMRLDYSQEYSNKLSNSNASVKIGKSRENYLNEITEESQNSDENISENSDMEKERSNLELKYRPRKNVGITWSVQPEGLEDLVSEFKNTKNNSSHIIKAVCSRSDCKCAFKNGEPLLLYPMMDASIAYATWEIPQLNSSSALSPSQRAGNSGYARQIIGNNNPLKKTLDAECQAELMIFKQCKGWYEILNENHISVPHFTSVEQIKRSRPRNFITRENVKVLIPPKTLQKPKSNITPELLELAQSTEILSESQPEVVKSGTIFKFVEYFANCKIVRNKRVKYVNVIFAIEKIYGSLDPENEDFQRFVYLGTEEISRDSYFPAKLSISNVAGPGNISGVHSISGILRKFRLPISVRPVAVLSSNNPSANSTSNHRDRASDNNSRQPELPLMSGLLLTEKHFLRLRSIYSGDLFILAAITNPERLYIVASKMLPDHDFYLGSTLDKKYLELVQHHNIHVSEFLSNGHTFNSMEYLLKHMQQSNYPVRFYQNDGNILRDEVERVFSETGHDPRVGPDCNLTPSQVDLIYDEIDEIYFFIRNGYYPPKKTSYSMRGREGPLNGDAIEHNGVITYKTNIQDTQQLKPKMNLSNRTINCTGVRRADELLAESLNISSKDSHPI